MEFDDGFLERAVESYLGSLTDEGVNSREEYEDRDLCKLYLLECDKK